MKQNILIQWQEFATHRLEFILNEIRSFPTLSRLGPQKNWNVMVSIVGSDKMLALNLKHRKKLYSTDILSFPAPLIFQDQGGVLGELIICFPLLQLQALEQGHSEEVELDLLIVHGVLHLLGMDHELGVKEARRMEKWETKILDRLWSKEIYTPAQKALRKAFGLIGRSKSGM